METTFLTQSLWGVYPYVCFTLFLVVPIIRMIYRPFGFSTRASGLFNRNVLGAASLALHWGILLVFVGHLAGFIGGLLGLEGWITFFYWAGLIGGFLTLFGSILALVRRLVVPEVRAMSQWDDYLVLVFLVPLVSLALYQVVIDKTFGVAYTASSWLASVCLLAPQPELMASASLLSKWHVFLALTFFALFPFTKLVHFWTFPINYFVRPYQAMRTARYLFQKKWEFALRSDKSVLVYSLALVVIFFGGFSLLLGYTKANRFKTAAKPIPTWTTAGRLAGMPLYISQCARCHGLSGDGKGQGAESPTFATLPRDFRAGKFAFISTGNGVASDEDLVRTVRLGLVTAGMPAFGELNEAQVRSLVAVTRGFAKAAGEAPGPPIQVPAPPPLIDMKKGRELFGMMCAGCHGQSGRGYAPGVTSPDFTKDLAGRPSRPSDLTKGQFKVSTDPEQIYLRIAAGIPPAMPAFREALQPEQIWSIVRYVEEEIMPSTTAKR